jgi:O-glycosyl hydrolase
MKTIKINIDRQKQSIDGWGTSLCWWANAVGGWTMTGGSGKEKREELIQLFFSEEGLDFNIVRYNIGGGDNPFEKQHMFHYRGIPCYKEKPDSKFNPEADWRQLWVLKRAHEIRKGDFIHEVFVNSPPWWMTKSLCSSGNVNAGDENLDRSHYEEFTQYCTDVLELLQKDLGIKVDYFVPMNEAASDYWAKGQRQEGCKVNLGESQTMLLTMAYEKLRQRKLDIHITGTDETNPTVALKAFHMLGDAVKNKILKKINYHHYADDDDALRQLQQITYKNGFDRPGYKLWMDEVCYGDGKDDFELAKKLIDAIYRDLNIANTNAWLIWQAMDTMSENIVNQCHWGLIEGMYQNQKNNELEGILDISGMGYDFGDYVITTLYYVMGHYSKYIKQGYIILENDGKEFYCISAISPDKDIVIAVLYNEDVQSKTVILKLDGFAVQKGIKIVSSDEKKWFTTEFDVNLMNIELEPKSITTLKLMK